MTVTKRAARAASSFFDRLLTIGPPPAPTPAPRLPSEFRDTPASAAGATSVPRPERRAPGVARHLAAPSPGKRDRRVRVERRRADRRKVDQGSPYGTERRTGADDRQADRRGSASQRQGIGLTRDYFAQADARPASRPGSDIPAHLLIRFKN